MSLHGEKSLRDLACLEEMGNETQKCILRPILEYFEEPSVNIITIAQFR